MRFKPATCVLHLALITMVVGACVTHFCAKQGEIHLRADKAQTIGNITLFLWDFQIVSDADGNPADYITELRMMDRTRSSAGGQHTAAVKEGTLRMNKPLKYHHWRFCQSDYDSDQMGVVLTYNYDPWGIGITYTGYALLLLGMIAFFFQRNTYFRVLLKQSVFGEKSRVFTISFIMIIAILALVMTKVVTPKPPLQPVLQTPLLGIHVSVIMLSYTLFAIIMINGFIGLVSALKAAKSSGEKQQKLFALSTRTATLSKVLLYPALFCLTTGIFIGAVWANMSWGRYWSWDPKETWALITMLVYAAILHYPMLVKSARATQNLYLVQQTQRQNLSPAQRKKQLVIYHTLCILAFLLVLFTYFGVSYFLGGMHSYK